MPKVATSRAPSQDTSCLVEVPHNQRFVSNPYHDSALRLREVHPGVEFAHYNMDDELVEYGRFISKPYVHVFPAIDEFLSWSTIAADAIMADGQRKQCYMQDMGIVSFPDGIWYGPFTLRSSSTRIIPARRGQ